MRAIAFAALGTVLLGSVTMAETVGPDAVKFGEYGEVEMALTAMAGDPVAGQKTFTNRKLGNCLACHVSEDNSDQLFHGEVGPELDGVADRWETAELRGIVVNSKKTFEGSIMPSFYRTENGARTLEKFAGKSILTAQQVEDVVAYLMTLKEE
jgi:sulfur-oxidizing protein SoxX